MLTTIYRKFMPQFTDWECSFNSYINFSKIHFFSRSFENFGYLSFKRNNYVEVIIEENISKQILHVKNSSF